MKNRKTQTALNQSTGSCRLKEEPQAIHDIAKQATYVESLRDCSLHAGDVLRGARDLLFLIVGPIPETDTEEGKVMDQKQCLKFALDHHPAEIHRNLYCIDETLKLIRKELRLQP